MKTVVIVQCRLSSTRLPKKALFSLENNSQKVLLDYTLSAMKKVSADEYYVACDYDSEKELEQIAERNNFKIFAGSKDDVLDRFCSLIELTQAKIVVRATADNPFLFFDAANELLDVYRSKYFGTVDYITYANLPHGSGIEIFSGDSLLFARSKTNLDYDHEHVGPALYNHQDNFNCLFLKSPEQYSNPELRTTIDTYADYLRARDAIYELNLQQKKSPYNSIDVLNVFKKVSISKKILFIPSIKKGQGTGHLLRALSLAKDNNGCVFLDFKNEKLSNDFFSNQNINFDEHNLIDVKSVIKDFDTKRIITKMPLKNEYDLIVCDKFKMTKHESKKYSNLGKTVFLDEGNYFKTSPDFSLNIIPSINSQLESSKKNNLFSPAFLSLPQNKKTGIKEIKKILICFGGEDKKNLAQKFVNIFVSKKNIERIDIEKLEITVVSKNKIEFNKHSISNTNIQVVDFISNLSEKLSDFDLVITHYGFTAFECIASKVPVLLSAPTNLHKKLSKKYGFYCIDKNKINIKSLSKALNNIQKLTASEFIKNELSEKKSINLFLENLATSKKYDCPLCKKLSNDNDKIIARTNHHTFRKCSKCKMIYISFSDDSERVVYEKSYFADEYKNQYGRTYLEDFESIKYNCISRVKNIDKISKSKKSLSNKNVLDIGCAYGPFLSAAKDFGFNVFGSDISENAIDYVKNKLGFNAIISSFADFDSQNVFNIEKFDVITMWYVIEHIKDLKSVLIQINKKLCDGGIFAFSTPNAEGLSRKINSQKFFEQSPKDHYSLFELSNTKKYLKNFGFKVVKIVPTGIHPERIPFVNKYSFFQKKNILKLLNSLLKILKIGDTYEVYCKKNSGIEN